METQALLVFTFNPPSQAEVDKLVAWLRNNPGFQKASKLERHLGLADRRLRQLAQNSEGLIISGPGSPGYCHRDHCPVETVSHIAETMISQGKRMIRRGLSMRARAHQALG